MLASFRTRARVLSNTCSRPFEHVLASFRTRGMCPGEPEEGVVLLCINCSHVPMLWRTRMDNDGTACGGIGVGLISFRGIMFFRHSRGLVT